jgi:hypothetical protein
MRQSNIPTRPTKNLHKDIPNTKNRISIPVLDTLLAGDNLNIVDSWDRHHQQGDGKPPFVSLLNFRHGIIYSPPKLNQSRAIDAT